MPEPSLDRQKVDSGLQKSHRQGMTQYMQRNVLAFELRQGLTAHLGCLMQHVNRTESCQALPAEAHEHRRVLVSADTALLEKTWYGCGHIPSQRHPTFFPAFASKHHFRLCA